MQPTYLKSTELQTVDPESSGFILYLGVAVSTQLLKQEIASKKEFVLHFLRKCRAFLITGAKEIKNASQ